MTVIVSQHGREILRSGGESSVLVSQFSREVLRAQTTAKVAVSQVSREILRSLAGIPVGGGSSVRRQPMIGTF